MPWHSFALKSLCSGFGLCKQPVRLSFNPYITYPCGKEWGFLHPVVVPPLISPRTRGIASADHSQWRWSYPSLNLGGEIVERAKQHVTAVDPWFKAVMWLMWWPRRIEEEKRPQKTDVAGWHLSRVRLILNCNPIDKKRVPRCNSTLRVPANLTLCISQQVTRLIWRSVEIWRPQGGSPIHAATSTSPIFALCCESERRFSPTRALAPPS